MGSTSHIPIVMSDGEIETRRRAIQNLLLQAANADGITHGQLVNGMFDRFVDTNGIDGSSVYTFGTGVCTTTTDRNTSWGPYVLNIPNPGATNLGVRQIHFASEISVGGSQIRLTLMGPESYGPTVLSHVCFAERSGSTVGATGSFGSSTFKEVLFSSQAGCYIPQGGTLVSDWLDFNLDESKDYMTILTFGATNANYQMMLRTSGIYMKGSATGDYNVQSPSGYSYYTDEMWCVSKIETQNGDQDMVLISHPVTALFTPSSATASVLVKNIDVSTKVYVSSSNTPSWTELTNLALVASDVGEVGVNQYTSDLVDIPGSSDRSMRWKFETDAGYDTACYGVCLNWS